VDPGFFKRGVQMKKTRFQTFLAIFPTIFLYFSEKGGFYTLDPLLW